jgi:hypothetical protein
MIYYLFDNIIFYHWAQKVLVESGSGKIHTVIISLLDPDQQIRIKAPRSRIQSRKKYLRIRNTTYDHQLHIK